LQQLQPYVLDALYGATAIKFASQVSDAAAHALARDMRTTPEFILNQPPFHFAAYVRGLTDTAVSVGIPAIDLNAAPRMSDEERRLVRQGIRDKYATSVGAVQPAAPLQTQHSASPASADSNVETDAAAKEW
jgi:hypothetical protein